MFEICALEGGPSAGLHPPIVWAPQGMSACWLRSDPSGHPFHCPELSQSRTLSPYCPSAKEVEEAPTITAVLASREPGTCGSALTTKGHLLH